MSVCLCVNHGGINYNRATLVSCRLILHGDWGSRHPPDVSLDIAAYVPWQHPQITFPIQTIPPNISYTGRFASRHFHFPICVPASWWSQPMGLFSFCANMHRHAWHTKLRTGRGLITVRSQNWGPFKTFKSGRYGICNVVDISVPNVLCLYSGQL